jgi:hypothetical protein
MSDGREETAEELAAQQAANERETEHRLRMRFDWDNLIEDLIEDGRQKGLFDNLRGKGQPLNLTQNPYSNGQEIAHGLLKDNNILPPWLAERNRLQEQTQALRTKIARVWQRYEQEYRFAQDEGLRGGLILGWDDEVQKVQADIVKINKLIDAYNLKRPLDNLEIYKLNLEDELARAGARRYLRDMSDL